MTTPNRGRGRGYGRGRGRSNNMLPYQETNIPLIGDWTTVHRTRNLQQLPAPQKKAEIPASSSYKDAAINDPPQEVTEFYENPVTEDIMYIEQEDIDMNPNDGWSIKTRYLESRGYPGLYGKTRPNLEMLLLFTESVTITHNYQNNNPENFINFSKCHINKILTPREWGLNPNGEKAIKIAEGKYVYFNYWDYIQAFTLAFYYQNPKNKHSWFFSINPEITNRPIPNWFYNWWSKFGPSLEILPEGLLNLYDKWNNHSPLISRRIPTIKGQGPCMYFIKFQIPWIWRWTITITRDKMDIPVIRRKFFYKWWTKMSKEDILKIENGVETTINDDQAKSKEQNSQESFMTNLKDYFQKIYPHESEEQIMVRTLDHMKNQFFKTFQVKNEDVSMKTSSSQGSMDSNTFDCLAGESQEEEEPTPEDFWDAMIHSMTHQAKKGKEQ